MSIYDYIRSYMIIYDSVFNGRLSQWKAPIVHPWQGQKPMHPTRNHQPPLWLVARVVGREADRRRSRWRKQGSGQRGRRRWRGSRGGRVSNRRMSRRKRRRQRRRRRRKRTKEKGQSEKDKRKSVLPIVFKLALRVMNDPLALTRLCLVCLDTCVCAH